MDISGESKQTDNRVTKWLAEISAAKKREKDYRKEGNRVLDIYEGKRLSSEQESLPNVPYNILYSNTETLLPALYSAVPRPVVQRRFKDDDPLGAASADAGQRGLEFLVDTNIEGYETYDETVRAAVLDALLPGRGVTSLSYDAEIGQVPVSPTDDKDEPLEPPATPEEYKKSELVCTETRSWNRVYFGYAKRWSKVPWLAYEEQIDKPEAVRLFGKEIAEQLNYTIGEEKDENNNRQSDDEDTGGTKTTTVYQLWDKTSKKVIFLSESYHYGYLKEDDDPLGLTGFFNMPKPLMFLEKSNDLLPVALYLLYENQATELNRLTKRITKLVEAIKARGLYDAELGDDLANIMDAEDNTLVPADKSASLAAEKGLANAIWFMPLEALTNTLIQLYQARQQCKQIIYEVTGISDIMRGSSNANETLGAQEIKKSFGTLRLKRLQSEVQRYARDLLRMMLEIAASKFSDETWEKMTGLHYLTAQEEEAANQIKMAAQQSGQPLDEKTQAFVSRPTWSSVLGLLRDDTQRAYRVDIESNSTVQPEATEDQKNIAEVMNAMAQYLNGVAPLVQSGALPFEAAQSMLLAITRRFRFGAEIEEYVKKMKAPEKPDDGKAAEQAKMQSDQQAQQAQQQSDLQKHSAEQQTEQLRLQTEAQNKQADEMAAAHEREITAQKEVEIKKIETAAAQADKALEYQWKEKIARMEADKKAHAQIEVAKIQAAATISSSQMAKASEGNGDETSEKKGMEEVLMRLTQALEMMAAPKETELILDANGRAIGSKQIIPSIQVASSEEIQ